MKISLLKISRKKEVIKRIELSELAKMIRENPEKDRVFNLRLNYQFYKPQRMSDGQITLDDKKHTVNLPRLLFAVECMNYKEMQKGLKYNGLVVVEVNGLKTYEDAVAIRNQAARMDETVMAFLGASGMSVKIVCRGELFGKEDGRGLMEDGRGKMADGRGKMEDVSSTLIYITRREGRIRISSGWTSSIWIPSWNEPSILVPTLSCILTLMHAHLRLIVRSMINLSRRPSRGKATT